MHTKYLLTLAYFKPKKEQNRVFLDISRLEECAHLSLIVTFKYTYILLLFCFIF